MLDYVQTNLPAIGGALTAAGAIVHSAYVIIVGAGGLRGVWRQFLNGPDKQP